MLNPFTNKNLSKKKKKKKKLGVARSVPGGQTQHNEYQDIRGSITFRPQALLLSGRRRPSVYFYI